MKGTYSFPSNKEKEYFNKYYRDFVSKINLDSIKDMLSYIKTHKNYSFDDLRKYCSDDNIVTFTYFDNCYMSLSDEEIIKKKISQIAHIKIKYNRYALSCEMENELFADIIKYENNRISKKSFSI